MAPVAVIKRCEQADSSLRPPALIAARAARAARTARWPRRPRWWGILRRIIGGILRRIIGRIAGRVLRGRRLISTLLEQSDAEQPAERRKAYEHDGGHNQHW